MESRAIAVRVTQGPLVKLEAKVSGAANLPADASSDFVWKRVDVNLADGSVDIELEKVIAGHTGLRVVDCALLVEDLAYTPDIRDFHRQLYARVRAAPDASASVTLDNALTTSRLPRGPLFDAVRPGQASRWRNVTRWWEGASELSLPIWVRSEAPGAACLLEFAAKPDERNVTKSIRLDEGPTVTHVVLPSGVDEALPSASPELARARAERTARLPKIDFGRRPTRFPILVDLRADSAAEGWEKDVAAYIGVNGFTGPLTERDVANGFIFNRAYNSAFHLGPGGYANVSWARMESDLQRDGERYAQDANWSRVQHLKLIDEAQAMSLESLAGEAQAEALFRAWLPRQQGAEGIPLRERKLVTSPGAEPRLYYFSHRFRAWLVAEFFRRSTKLAHRFYPRGVKTTQNMSDGAVIYANMYAQGNDYFEYFRSGALDVALSEDWTNAGATRQLCGWNVQLLRAATREREQPIHMYVIAYSNRKPFEVKLKAVSDVAQGAKLINLYSYTPRYLGGEVGWAESMPMIRASAELTREIGAAEDVLIDAMPVRSKVAIIYSTTADVWAAGRDLTHGNERMLTYLALRHAQVQSDVLNEADVEAGRLSAYRVAYLQDVELPRRATRDIVAWVNAGGTLVLGPEAGTRDEWSRSDDTLYRSFRLHRDASRTVGPSTMPTGSLDKLPADVTQVDVGGTRVGAPLLAHSFSEGSDQQVLARFTDGRPAAVARDVGRGKVFALGFMAATVYMRDALSELRQRGDAAAQISEPLAAAFALDDDRKPKGGTVSIAEVWGAQPTRYSAELRSLIALPAQSAPGLAAADEPLVETTLLEGKRGFVVPLANYAARPLTRVGLRVRPSRKAGRVMSSRNGELAVTPDPDGSFLVELPLESTDFVFGEWASQRP